MFIRGRKRLAPLYRMSEEGEGGGGGTFTAEQVQEEIAKAVDSAVGGLKTKNQELLASLNETKSGLKAWEGLDPEQVRGFMDKLGADEELKLIAEGQHEKAWEKRLEKVSAKHQSSLETIASERDTFKTDLEKANDQIRDLVIDQQVLSSFIAEKGIESAAPDVVLRAKSAFKIEDGVPIARDKDGEIIRGTDGAITISEWVAQLKTDAPHLFPASQGAGAQGAQGGAGGSDLVAQMETAAANNDMALYRKLREQAAK